MGKYLISILRPIVTEADIMINKKLSLLEIKKYVVTEVQKHTRMNPTDMQTIIRKTNQSPTGIDLQRYLWDSLLKFEGEGVI